MTWAVNVPCGHCSAVVGDECRLPSGELAQRPHRARLLLSVVGLASAPAAGVVERLLREADARATTSTYTLPDPPRKP
jgi:hypothetical protein